MADNESQIRKSIEDAAHHDSQQMQARLHGKPENRPIQSAFKERSDPRRRGGVRMQIDWDVQRFGRFKYRPKLRIVEILAPCVRVYDCALQAQIADAPL